MFTKTPLLTRRRLLTGAALAPAALVAARFMEPRPALAQAAKYPHTLPALPYDFAALEPHIDAQTMQIHHGKHHQLYVDRLNSALSTKLNWQDKTAEELVMNIAALPEEVRTAVQNHGGGHANHSLFWQLMKPAAQGGGRPGGRLADAIIKKFGSLDDFTKAFNDAGAARFGSGWAWLVNGPEGLKVISTANQDSPLMQGLTPILGNDVWEHAYYLKYQNRRTDYLKAWWNVVNWDEANRRFALKG